MDLSKNSTSELLSYSTILENIVNTNLDLQREMHDAVSKGFCTEKEIEKLHNKSIDAHTEADAAYVNIQKELDLRMKRDLGMKFGIRRSQSIIKELDAFAAGKNAEHMKLAEKQTQEAIEISKETEATMSIVSDDTTE